MRHHKLLTVESRNKIEEKSASNGKSFLCHWSNCDGTVQEIKLFYHRLNGSDQLVHARVDAENRSVHWLCWPNRFKHRIAEIIAKLYKAPRGVIGPCFSTVCKSVPRTEQARKEDQLGETGIFVIKLHSREKLETDAHKHAHGHPSESLVAEESAQRRRAAPKIQLGSARVLKIVLTAWQCLKSDNGERADKLVAWTSPKIYFFVTWSRKLIKLSIAARPRAKSSLSE